MDINEAGVFIKEEIECFGEKCIINCHSGDKICCFVMLESLIKNNKTNFEAQPSLIGNTRNDYYSVIFPYDVDVRSFGINDVMQIGDRSYYSIRADRVCIGDRVAYFRAVLKSIEEEGNVF